MKAVVRYLLGFLLIPMLIGSAEVAAWQFACRQDSVVRSECCCTFATAISFQSNVQLAADCCCDLVLAFGCHQCADVSPAKGEVAPLVGALTFVVSFSPRPRLLPCTGGAIRRPRFDRFRHGPYLGET